MRLGAIHVRRTIHERKLNSCRRQFIASRLTRIQHIFNENSVPRGGIIYQNVCYRSYELAVLDDGAARHECVQVGTTISNEILTYQMLRNLLIKELFSNVFTYAFAH